MPDDKSDPWKQAPPHEVVVYPDAELLIGDVVDRLIIELVEHQARASIVHIGVTGGGMGQVLWPALAGRPGSTDVAWAGVHVWFSDERFVPSGDPDRNDGAVLAVAEDLGLPVANIHSVLGPDSVLDVASAARHYETELAAWAQPDAPVDAPVCCVSLLGIGPDGHVASLFPGFRADESATVVPIIDSPKPPPQRVSFTRATLRNCDQLWFMASGEAKADAVARALSGDDPVRTPAAGVHGRSRTLWFVDEALARRL